jgi:hypothetical protein
MNSDNKYEELWRVVIYLDSGLKLNRLVDRVPEPAKRPAFLTAE